jgi:hypothetical protein
MKKIRAPCINFSVVNFLCVTRFRNIYNQRQATIVLIFTPDKYLQEYDPPVSS